MSPCSVFLVVSFLNILRCFHHVSACDYNCADRPVLTPSRLVVKFGDPTFATCVACQEACLPVEETVINIEANLGVPAQMGTTVTWTVDRMTEWDLTPKCFYTDKNDEQCCTNLHVTVYKPPEGVSFSFNHSGPLTEGSQYILQCSVLNVAPVKNLNVTFYRGETPLGHMSSNNAENKPVSETFSLSYTTSKEDNGAQFWCEAKLELGAEGPQPPPVVKSEALPATVYYGPELKVPADPTQIDITKGKTLRLTCLAEGNPHPSFTWTGPSNNGQKTGNNLTVESVDSQDEGQYVCTVSNNRKAVKVVFDVKVHENIWPYVIAAIVAGAVLVSVCIAVFYIFYYKQNKMGKYRLKDVFRLGSVRHTAVPLGV